MNTLTRTDGSVITRYNSIVEVRWRFADRILIVSLAAVPALAVCCAWNPTPLTSAGVELGSFVVGLGALLNVARGPDVLRPHMLFLAAVALPVIGCVQLATELPAYPYASLLAILYWGAVAALVLAGQALLATRQSRSFMLSAVSLLGLLATFLELQQIYCLHRFNVLATGFPLLSSNYYAELAELILPIAVTRMFRDQQSWWLHLALAALMVSTVIAAAARVGSLLVVAETVIVAGLTYSKTKHLRKRWKAICALLVVLTATLVSLQGPSVLISRLRDADPLAGRADVARSAVDMIRSHPWVGYGMGNFPVAYPAFARFDNGYFVNHAHNDWLESWVEGGPVLLTALAIFVGVASWSGAKSTWGLGLAILPLHAALDFPFKRSGVMLLYAVIAAAAVARQREVLRHLGNPLLHLAAGEKDPAAVTDGSIEKSAVCRILRR